MITAARTLSPAEQAPPQTHLTAEKLAALWARRARDGRRRRAAERGEDWRTVR